MSTSNVNMMNSLGADDFNMYFFGTTVYSVFFTYWFFGGIFLIFDYSQWPEFLKKYKVQSGTNEPVDRKLMMRVVRGVLFNQIFISIPLSYLGYYIKKSRGIQESIFDVPDFGRVIYDLIICIMVDEIGFYYTHRLVHQKHLYKWIHKKHHEWSAPISITAIYAHPLEHILSNVLPVGLGPVFANSHLSVAWIWYTLAQLTTLNNHSGFHFPFFHSSEFHDFHHMKFMECYGKLGLLDRIHNTDKLFRKSIYSYRHRILYSLKSAKEMFPDKSD
ncbi:hypothetical protein ACKWTF_005719 [Chironomus riparius]